MTTNAPSGFKATSAKIFSTANHIYIYGKDSLKNKLNKIYIQKDYDSAYKFYLINPEDDFSKWKYKSLIEVLSENEGYKSADDFKKDFSKTVINEKLSEFAFKNKNQVFRTAAVGGGALIKRNKTVLESKKNKGVVMQHPNEDIENFYILNGEMIVFWGNNFKNIDGNYVPAQALTDVWTDISFTGIANEGSVTLKNGKKPELLLKRIIELSTEENDLVLDYHLGSGTTCAVAHKMGRQYIGIEQLDYDNNDSVIRLQNVINKDTTGISKAVNWQGGGDFIYFELAKWNEEAKEEINTCKSLDDLVKLFDTLYEKYFLNYNLKIKEFKDKVINEDEFKALSLEEQKRMFLTMLDLNQMYVQKSEMEDKRFGISEEDQKSTNQFYNEK